MKIRMKIPVSGSFHGLTSGVKVGDVVDVDDENGARYCVLGYAEQVHGKEERAVVDPPVETATKERAEPVKPRPGRPASK